MTRSSGDTNHLTRCQGWPSRHYVSRIDRCDIDGMVLWKTSKTPSYLDRYQSYCRPIMGFYSFFADYSVVEKWNKSLEKILKDLK